MYSFRNARWHLLDMKAKSDMWEAAVGHRLLAERLFQTAIDLADARQGALFVVLRDPQASLPLLVSPADQLDAPHGSPGDAPTRGQMMYMLRGRTATGLDRAVLMGLARTDGATVMDATGRLLAIGAILRTPSRPNRTRRWPSRAPTPRRRGPHERRAEGERGRISFHDQRDASGISEHGGAPAFQLPAIGV
jgi:hypothetical protein